MSGFVARALQQYVGEVDTISPAGAPWWLQKMVGAIAWASVLFSGAEYAGNQSLLKAWYASRVLQHRLREGQYDFICVTDKGSGAWHLKTPIPMISLSDTTFRLNDEEEEMRGQRRRMSKFSRWEGNRMQGRFLRGGLAVVFASQWAARSALSDYKVPAGRIFVLPPGGRIAEVPELATIRKKFDNHQLTLLFYGQDWEGKGGPIALNTLASLQEVYGMDARLIICGCTPPEAARQQPGVVVFSSLDKNNAEDYKTFTGFLSEAHFLIQPSRSDVTLPVACEGNAYGVPVITTETGGIPDIVQDGVNGYCLPYHSDGRMYSLLISELFRDQERYRGLVESSRKRYDERLNWGSWSQRFKEIYDKAISGLNHNENSTLNSGS